MIIHINSAEFISLIDNAAYISNTTKIITTYQNACSECICNAFFSNISSPYVGLNCYKNNKTCQLFVNYSTSTIIEININSTFMFIQRPPPPSLLLNVTTGNSIAFTLIKFIYAFSLRSFIVFPLSGELVAGYGNGTSGAALNALTFPWGLAMDNNENLYVADFGNARIMKISTGTLAGSVVAGIGTSGNSINQLEQPTEIAIDKDLNIYINDDFNYRIMLWTKN